LFSFLFSEKNADCTPCPVGKSATVVGSATDPCSDCTAGKYAHEEGLDACLFCIQGTEYKSRTVLCSKTITFFLNVLSCYEYMIDILFSFFFFFLISAVCKKGQYQQRSDALSPTCVDCPAGKLNPDDGIAAFNHHTCEPCPSNLPVSGIGASYCFGCPAGWSTGVGAVPCVACDPGMQGNSEGTSCSDCSAGTYQPESGTAFCL